MGEASGGGYFLMWGCTYNFIDWPVTVQLPMLKDRYRYSSNKFVTLYSISSNGTSDFVGYYINRKMLFHLMTYQRNH